MLGKSCGMVYFNKRMSKGIKPRRQACSQKSASEFFRGLGCPQQAKASAPLVRDA